MRLRPRAPLGELTALPHSWIWGGNKGGWKGLGREREQKVNERKVCNGRREMKIRGPGCVIGYRPIFIMKIAHKVKRK